MVIPAAHSRLLIFESEMRVIASRSCRPDGCEDGFYLWGYYTRGGRQFIHLVTVSGPHASRSPAYYVGDLDFFRRSYSQMSKGYGCACVGWGHDHHTLGLDRPSGVDTQSTMSLAQRNGFHRWCEIITTAEPSSQRSLWSARLSRTSRPGVRVNAYSYLDPQQGQLAKTKLQVLPGISPLRLALMYNGDVPREVLGEEGLFFPLSHIIYDRYEEEDNESNVSDEDGALEELARQCRELPEQWQQNIRFMPEEGHICVRLQLSPANALTLQYARLPQLTVKSVVVTIDGAGSAYDLTQKLAGLAKEKRLNHICEHTAAWIRRKNTAHRADRDGPNVLVVSQKEMAVSEDANTEQKGAKHV